MVVSIEEARHVARLARLALSDDQLGAFAVELTVVLDHFESLSEFASTDESYPDRRDPINEPRPDRVGAMLTPGEALHNAPASEDGQFSVPGFLPEES